LDATLNPVAGGLRRASMTEQGLRDTALPEIAVVFDLPDGWAPQVRCATRLLEVVLAVHGRKEPQRGRQDPTERNEEAA
jgi:hypothetical protein